MEKEVSHKLEIDQGGVSGKVRREETKVEMV